MEHAYICDLGKHEGKEVILKGWVYNVRSSGKIRFVIIRDGSGFVQCVASKIDVSPEVFDCISGVDQEASVIVRGRVRSDKRAPGGYEIMLTDFELVSPAENYPITPKEHGASFLLDHRHLWLRSKKQMVVMRVRHHLIAAIRDFFNSRGFLNLDTPIFTPNACEGTSTLFETDYFGDKAYLSQSGQLYNEATAAAFGKVYCFGPTFRAEKSKTRRHLTEFWMVEPEIAFAGIEDIMDLSEEFIENIIARILDVCGDDIRDVLGRDTSPLEKVKRPFVRMHYNEAVDLLKKSGVDFQWGNDFGGADETIIAESSEKPTIIHRYPSKTKAFYMQPDPEGSEYSLSMDLLAPEGYGELIGGGERINDLSLLKKRIEENNLPESAFQWYLDLRKYGSVPHAGFGLGLERTISYVCGLKHLRESIPFPRLLNRLNP